VDALVRSQILDKEKSQNVEFLMFEQVYLEMMESGKSIDAIKLL
jgi:hypothetical protein